jgi:hypothetical protein
MIFFLVLVTLCLTVFAGAPTGRKFPLKGGISASQILLFLEKLKNISLKKSFSS